MCMPSAEKKPGLMPFCIAEGVDPVAGVKPSTVMALFQEPPVSSG
jgi:hypothetical protein